jgi:hypothetical protein
MRPPPEDSAPRSPGGIVTTGAAWLVALSLAGAARIVHAQDSELDEQLIRRQLDEVLAQPEFSRLRIATPPTVETPGWFERFSNWLLDLSPRWNFDPTNTGLFGFLKLVPAIVGVIVVAGIIMLIIKLINNWRSRRIETEGNLPSLDVSVGATPPGELPADEYLRRAQLAAANGIFSEAIAQLLLGTLSATERHGLIRFRKGLTYRDYRRALRKIRPAQEAFQQLCGIYLPVGFGRRQAGRDQFDESLRHYRQVVQSVETPTAGVSVSPAHTAPDSPAASQAS